MVKRVLYIADGSSYLKRTPNAELSFKNTVRTSHLKRKYAKQIINPPIITAFILRLKRKWNKSPAATPIKVKAIVLKSLLSGANTSKATPETRPNQKPTHSFKKQAITIIKGKSRFGVAVPSERLSTGTLCKVKRKNALSPKMP